MLKKVFNYLKMKNNATGAFGWRIENGNWTIFFKFHPNLIFFRIKIILICIKHNKKYYNNYIILQITKNTNYLFI